MASSKKAAILTATLLLTICSAVSDGKCTTPSTYLWLSPFAEGAQFADVPTLNTGESVTAYLWGRVATGDSVSDLDIRLSSSLPVNFQGGSLDNPILGRKEGKNIVRFEHTPTPVSSDSSLDMQAFTLGDRQTFGSGFGAATLKDDPFFDDTNNAWRIGQIQLSSTRSSEFFLQIGNNGIQGIDGNGDVTPDFDVVFGDASDPALCSLDSRLTNSQTLDAIVTGGTLDAVAPAPGSYWQGESATLSISLGAHGKSLPWAIANGAHLDGTLDLISSGHADPSVRGEFEKLAIISADNMVGEFATVQFDGSEIDFTAGLEGEYSSHQGNGLFRILTYGEADVTLTNYFALPGDANGDFEVDFADFLLMANNFGKAGEWTEADFTGDRRITFRDLLMLSSSFGASIRTAGVPEPSHVGCVVVIGLLVIPYLLPRH